MGLKVEYGESFLVTTWHVLIASFSILLPSYINLGTILPKSVILCPSLLSSPLPVPQSLNLSLTLSLSTHTHTHMHPWSQKSRWRHTAHCLTKWTPDLCPALLWPLPTAAIHRKRASQTGWEDGQALQYDDNKLDGLKPVISLFESNFIASLRSRRRELQEGGASLCSLCSLASRRCTHVARRQCWIC